MPTSSRRARFSVIERLLEDPQNFSFVQAVRLLERSAVLSARSRKSLQNTQLKEPHREYHTDRPVARFSPPLKEVVRFTHSNSLSFPGTEIGSIKDQSLDNGSRQWKMMVNFIGLTGAMGVMPFHYTEMILQRLRQRDSSLAKFLDLFDHRTTSLFFQASSKYHLPLEYERSQLHQTNKSRDCTQTHALLSMIGLGTRQLRNRQAIRDESLIFYSGLLTQQVKTTSGLRQIIESYFGVPAEVEGFIGQWQELIDDVRTRLPDKTRPKGQNVCLGRSAMLGQRGWFAQGKSRINIGPLNKEQFAKFAPGTGALQSLNELVSTYLGMEQDFDFVINVNRSDVPDKIALEKSNPPLLAWNTWLSGKPNTNTEQDELLEIKVSSKRLQ